MKGWIETNKSTKFSESEREKREQEIKKKSRRRSQAIKLQTFTVFLKQNKMHTNQIQTQIHLIHLKQYTYLQKKANIGFRPYQNGTFSWVRSHIPPPVEL